MKYELSTPTVDEMAFVHDAWIKSWRKSPWAGTIRNDQYEATQRATIQGILLRGAKITVALAPQVEGIHTGRRIMGFIVTEPDLEVLHYFYVKSDFRHHGIARALLNHDTTGWYQPRYTHRTRQSVMLPKVWRWDPTVARVLDPKITQPRTNLEA